MEKIYKFVGLRQHEEVDRFIETMTKNSSDISLKWKEELSLDLIQEIEKTCFDVMKAFGYTSVSNLKENTSESLVKNMGCRDCVYPIL